MVTTDPSAAKPTWNTPTNIDRPNALTGVSCPSTSLCVTVDNVGFAVVGHGSNVALPIVPSAGQIKASLVLEITPHGKATRIATLLKKQGYPLSFKALGAGRVVIDWYYLPDGAHLRSGRPKPVLVAVGTATFSRAGKLQITIKLTANGKRLLNHAKRLNLSASGTFTPTAKHAVVATQTFTLTL